jgi:hypothetical protein
MQITIPDNLIEKLIGGIMNNFPEASAGNALACIGWRYFDTKHPDGARFVFSDGDMKECKDYTLHKPELLKAFPLMFSKWPKGCTPLPKQWNDEAIDDWLCQADAMDFDAFVQLAIFGEVIYG